MSAPKSTLAPVASPLEAQLSVVLPVLPAVLLSLLLPPPPQLANRTPAQAAARPHGALLLDAKILPPSLSTSMRTTASPLG